MTGPAIPGRPLRRHPGRGTDDLVSGPVSDEQGERALPATSSARSSRGVDQHGLIGWHGHQPFEPQPPSTTKMPLWNGPVASTVAGTPSLSAEIGDPRVGGVVITMAARRPDPVAAGRDGPCRRGAKRAPVGSSARQLP
jgi:hypothetical protein